MIYYKLENLNLDDFVLGPKIPKNIYDLFAVSQHSGSKEGSHYASSCKNFRHMMLLSLNVMMIYDLYSWKLFYCSQKKKRKEKK